jgi:hypothetical protein
MKSLTLRSSIALACALSLAGCGSGGGNLLLSGSVYGLNRAGLVLQNGSEKLEVASGASGFYFTQMLNNDQDFDVTVATQPDAATCVITNGKGRTTTFNISSVQVACVTEAYEIGGKVTGLNNATGLVLANGQERREIAADGTFTMNPVAAATTTGYAAGKVFVGSPYGVSVLTQPAGRTCTVTNGSGIMAKANVTTIQVTCVA